MTTRPIRVVDTSVVAAFLFAEPEADEAADRLADADLVAPSLLHYELASVCRTKCRRFPDQRDRLLIAYGQHTRLAIREIDVDHAALILLAEQTGLTVYDASYLWLARSLDAELLTFDRRLQLAAATGRR